MAYGVWRMAYGVVRNLQDRDDGAILWPLDQVLTLERNMQHDCRWFQAYVQSQSDLSTQLKRCYPSLDAGPSRGLAVLPSPGADCAVKIPGGG